MPDKLLNLNIVPLGLDYVPEGGTFPTSSFGEFSDYIRNHCGDSRVCLLDIDEYGQPLYLHLKEEFGEDRIVYANQQGYFQRPNGSDFSGKRWHSIQRPLPFELN